MTFSHNTANSTPNMCHPSEGEATSSMAGPKSAVRWAHGEERDGQTILVIDDGELPVSIAQSCATGRALISNDRVGADLIRLAAGERFAPHTHVGDHLLLILAGHGTITVNGRVMPTHPGEIHLIPGHEPHAVGAVTNHVILAVGAPHRPVDARDRMDLIHYHAMTASFQHLYCEICDVMADLPERLHHRGCPHCPCEQCAIPTRM
jgi:quercetin dioxygenase-like cupin family protein